MSLWKASTFTWRKNALGVENITSTSLEEPMRSQARLSDSCGFSITSTLVRSTPLTSSSTLFVASIPFLQSSSKTERKCLTEDGSLLTNAL